MNPKEKGFFMAQEMNIWFKKYPGFLLNDFTEAPATVDSVGEALANFNFNNTSGTPGTPATPIQVSMFCIVFSCSFEHH
jgi:hypothetical protein